LRPVDEDLCFLDLDFDGLALGGRPFGVVNQQLRNAESFHQFILTS
jgi:hypothetical protein